MQALKNLLLGAQAGQGGDVTIAVINKATVDLGVSLGQMVAALQKFYDTEFKPVWGYSVSLYIANEPRPSDWMIYLLDDADAANALGYHELTEKGQPISKVFVKDTIKNGSKVSVTVCHELLEMAIDPLANLWAVDTRTGIFHAYEMCDAVEDDTIEVDGVTMSNFVHPSWFEAFDHPPGTKFDHMGLLTKPFSLRKGGYDIVMQNGNIRNIFGSMAKKKRFAKEDRTMHRSEYRKGEVYRKKRGRPVTRKVTPKTKRKYTRKHRVERVHAARRTKQTR